MVDLIVPSRRTVVDSEVAGLSLLCPICSSSMVSVADTAWSCAGGHQFPVIAGILDCRPAVEGFDTDADQRLAELLAEQTGSFEDLLSWYWAQRSDVARELAARFVAGDLIGARRAEVVVGQIEAMWRRGVDGGIVALEVGAGTAALSTALARRVDSVVATDISLAWLVLARRRLADEGVHNVSLIAATGDALPFADGALDLVVAADVIEHVRDPRAVARSCHRVLAPGGMFWLSTPNRFSLALEPHVQLWGVGFVPRRWASAYVRAARGVDYEDVHTLSLGELRRVLGSTGAEVAVTAPSIPDPVREMYSPLAGRLIDAYNHVQHIAGLRPLLLPFTPLFHAVVRKGPAGA